MRKDEPKNDVLCPSRRAGRADVNTRVVEVSADRDRQTTRNERGEGTRAHRASLISISLV